MMELSALDGSNPLGFLAAVGMLRLCNRIWPCGEVGMSWVQRGHWRPALHGVPVGTGEELCTILTESAAWAPLDVFEVLGNNLTVPAGTFRCVAESVANDLLRDGSGQIPENAAAFLAAFGNEVCVDSDKDRIEYSDLSFITGSGHQHFLGTARNLARQVGAEKLREALLGPWLFQDDGSSFRWDPGDAKEYALRWRNPSDDGVVTVWGANRLAFEALPMFPTVPTTGARLKTTGFRKGRGFHDFTWPIWTARASADTVRSLLALDVLRDDSLPARELAERGIAQVFRCQRVRIGQGANFKVSFRPAYAV